MDHKILWLRERFSWMGKHSGYDQLCEHIAQLIPGDNFSVWRQPNKPVGGIKELILSRLKSEAKSGPRYDLKSTDAEVKALWTSFLKKPDIIHILYTENNLGILPHWKQRLFPSLKIVGTAHQPASWWRLWHSHPNSVAALDALILPSTKEISYFEQYIPGRVHFIPHGVDTEFFKPSSENTDNRQEMTPPRCLFSGRWLRDLDTLAKVFDQVITHNPAIQLDIILPKNSRTYCEASLLRLGRHDQVHWYAGISDGHLRKLYQRASMLVLPLLDCTANNVLVEAIACGLPIVSNEVGGLPNYTRDSFADLLPVGEVDGMVNAILRIADDPQEREKRGIAARLFAEENLSWDKVAIQTLDLYQKVITAQA